MSPFGLATGSDLTDYWEIRIKVSFSVDLLSKNACVSRRPVADRLHRTWHPAVTGYVFFRTHEFIDAHQSIDPAC
jgi:hypothetical protein